MFFVLQSHLHCMAYTLCTCIVCFIMSTFDKLCCIKCTLCSCMCRAISRDLYRGERPLGVHYCLEIKTSDMRGAGTSVNVFLIMHGHQASSAKHHLAAAPHDFDRYPAFVICSDRYALRRCNITQLQYITSSLRQLLLQSASAITFTPAAMWQLTADALQYNMSRMAQHGITSLPNILFVDHTTCVGDTQGLQTTYQFKLRCHFQARMSYNTANLNTLTHSFLVGFAFSSAAFQQHKPTMGCGSWSIDVSAMVWSLLTLTSTQGV